MKLIERLHSEWLMCILCLVEVEIKTKFDLISAQEQARQKENMKMAQEKELYNIEQAQRLQFSEFSHAWDKYMEDYEATAFDLVEQLKKKQVDEIEELREAVTHNFIKGHRWPKDIIDTRKQEKIFHSVKDYDKAEAAKRFAD